jgi:hypothetical protein
MSAPGFSSTPQAGISATYGNASAVKLQYSELVSISLAANEINLVDAASYGHRVQVDVAATDLNTKLTWARGAGALAPTASVDASGLAALITAGIAATGFVDVDSQSNGLSFSSASLDSTTDPRLRPSGANDANDLVMAYVLYKLYGKTTYPTIDNIFNLEDASGMTSSVDLENAIRDSLVTKTPSVVKLFKDLISSDPQRFFDASGKQVPGIFETNADVSGSGSWRMTAGDVIEVRVEFTFAAAITRRDVTEQQIDSNTEPAATRNIAAGEKFAIRLQIHAV